jgi:hypothetical protein
MSGGVQVFEKNRFLLDQNRDTTRSMSAAEIINHRRKTRLMLLAMAIALAAAIIAPMTVLAG